MKKGLLESIARGFSWRRPITTYRRVQLLYSIVIRGRSFQLKRIKQQNIDYLNVGCGSTNYENFVNLDYHWQPHVHICWDITKGIPLESNTIKGVFVEHCLEHITFSQCQEALFELYRILKPDGIIRVIVPDAELFLDLYQKEKNGENVSFPYVTEDAVKRGYTPMMAINRIFRGHDHKYAYDLRTLKMLLKNAGFQSICKVDFMEGTDKNLLVDDEGRKIESLYIEAFKLLP